LVCQKRGEAKRRKTRGKEREGVINPRPVLVKKGGISSQKGRGGKKRSTQDKTYHPPRLGGEGGKEEEVMFWFEKASKKIEEYRKHRQEVVPIFWGTGYLSMGVKGAQGNIGYRKKHHLGWGGRGAKG